MDYYESAEDKTITQRRAMKELDKHNCTDYMEFVHFLGCKPFYKATDVLNFLGY